MKARIYLTLFSILTTLLVCGQDSSITYLFVGSYTSGEKAEGIIVYELEMETGQLTEVERERGLVNPSFVAGSPNRRFLYACTDTKLDTHGSVSAFGIDSLTGKLTFLNKQTTGGRNPVHVVIDETNNFLIASNYTDAGISVHRCNADGSLQPSALLKEYQGKSVIKGRQNKAHIHSCTFSPDGHFVFAPDLGSDRIHVLSFDQKKLLNSIDSLGVETAKGAGPRHFTFHPSGSFAYCVEELSGTIALYRYANGQLSHLDTYDSYSNRQEEYASSDIHVSPDGKHLYASNRQDENSISIFAIDQSSGKLTLIAHQSTYGKTPRSFAIDPTGNFLIVANQSSGELIVFRRNFATGLLTKQSEIIGLKSPSSLKLIKYGR